MKNEKGNSSSHCKETAAVIQIFKCLNKFNNIIISPFTWSSLPTRELATTVDRLKKKMCHTDTGRSFFSISDVCHWNKFPAEVTNARLILLKTSFGFYFAAM